MNYYQDLTALRMQHRTEQWLTLHQVAERWGLHYNTARKLSESMRCWKSSRNVVRVPLSEVLRVEREWMQ
jgi:hypothetical protein